MFQEPKKDGEGTIISCKMHDLVHDLSRWVTKDECRVISSGNDPIEPVQARHCAIKLEAVGRRDIGNLAGVGNLRTFIYSYHVLHDEPISMVKKFQNVRVLILRNCGSRICFHLKHLRKLVHLRHLDLSGCEIKQLPASIEKLKELRYLHLSWCTSITTLPKAIASLSNLRTLDLTGCLNLTKMPDEIPASLRHLDVEGCLHLRELPERLVSLPHLQVINLRGCSLEELPEGITAMASLRRLNITDCMRLKKLPQGIGKRNDVVVTLDRFPVVAAGGDAGGGGCRRGNIGDLGGMNMHLPTGRLEISNLQEVGSGDEARTAELEHKTCLQFLHLSWDYNPARTGDDNYITTTENKNVVVAAGGVLEGLHPPPELLHLILLDYPGLTFPSWMGDGGAFRYLRQVGLFHCENCTQLPPLGQLPNLVRLTISELPGMTRVGREFLGGPSPSFPCLTDLTFENMRSWSEWVVTLPTTGTTSTSEEGEGSEIPPPVMPVLQELALLDCPKLKAVPPIFTAVRFLEISSELRFLAPIHGSSMRVCIESEVRELPAGLLHHRALTELTVSDLPNLKSLPEEVMQLTNLQRLDIYRCDELRREWNLTGGQLRHKIAHIPHIRIDERDMQRFAIDCPQPSHSN